GSGSKPPAARPAAFLFSQPSYAGIRMTPPFSSWELAMTRSIHARVVCAMAAVMALAISAGPSAAQGVTTASITGVVKDAQGGVIPGASITAVHEPSGTTYEAVSQADGRYFIQGMRVGGPYKVTASLPGFTTEVRNNLTLTLGVAQDLEFTL